MINRDNYKLVVEYVAYMDEVRQLSDKTVTSGWTSLRHLLEWSDDVPFSKSPEIRPTFPRYVADRLSPSSVGLICGVAQRFFSWIRMSGGRRHSKITELWIETLVSPKSSGDAHKEHHEYTVDEVRKIVALPVESLSMQRDKAAVALMFLSGIRIGAFVTLPIDCVDLGSLEIRQWPEMGVHTKRMKRATTFLLSIPDLLDVARKWDDMVRSQLHGCAPWYAVLDQGGTQLHDDKPSVKRSGQLVDGLRRLCDRAGISYRSPHKLRHGFAVYGLKAARDMADLEAVSKNLMHKNLKVTLDIYAVLNQADVKDRIVKLGNPR